MLLFEAMDQRPTERNFPEANLIQFSKSVKPNRCVSVSRTAHVQEITANSNIPATFVQATICPANVLKEIMLAQNPRLPTPIDIPVLASYLMGYDPERKDFVMNGLTHGFRVCYQGPRNVSRTSVNHYSALIRPQHTQQIIEDELSKNQLIGPFKLPPFTEFISSPIALVPKTDGSFRFIHNLSWPPKNSINWSIDKADSSVKYETIDHFIALIQQWGKGALMGKTDLKNAFRILPLSPLDYQLLGLLWKGEFYINCTLCMGLSTSCALFEAFSTSLHWILVPWLWVDVIVPTR